MDIPADWISEAELAAASGVAEGDRGKFHRNLVNWRHHGVVPERYQGLSVPLIWYRGVGVGNEPFYPPVMIPMVHRIDELRRQSRNMNRWLWQLWLDGFPIDIIGWCRKRLIKFDEMFSNIDEKRLLETATRKPARRSDPRRSFYRRLMARGWSALITWAIRVAIGARPSESVFDAVSPPRSALARLFGSSTQHSVIREGLADSPIEEISIARLLVVLNEEIGSDELEKARQDCWVLSHSSKVRTFTGIVLAAIWGWVDSRAMLLPGLILLHRSPDHQAGLLEVIKLHTNSSELHQLEIPHARG